MILLLQLDLILSALRASATQSCSLGLDVSVSRRIFQTSRSRQSVGRSRSRLGLKAKRLCLVSVSGHNVSFTSEHLSKFFSFFFHSFSYKTNMSDISLQLFSAPCSSAASERVFSQSDLIIRPTRSRLSPSKLAKLCFLTS